MISCRIAHLKFNIKYHCFKFSFPATAHIHCVIHPFALLNDIFSAVKLNSPEIINAIFFFT